MLADKLNEDQLNAYQAMLEGKNVFLTGEAGTGKSFVTNAFIEACQSLNKNLLITAPTGVAAINISGATIHKTFQAPTTPIIDETSSIKVPAVIDTADIILIDEISMCRVDLFGYIARVILASERRCGQRKQLIVVGDFFQLPPVVGKFDREILEKYYPNSTKFYAFESPYWKDFAFENIALTQVVRQSDPVFIKELNKARIGDASCVDFFNRKFDSMDSEDMEAIVLCSTNKGVDEINDKKLNAIYGRSKLYDAEIEGNFNPSQCLADEILRIKRGARVMSLVNDKNDDYQNGSLGTVVYADNYQVTVAFDNGKVCDIQPHKWTSQEYEVYQVRDDQGNLVDKLRIIELGSFTQIPLKIAYAITIHKSQGQTFDRINLIPYAFDVGQLYVALSRVKSLDGLHLMGRMTREYLKCDQKVIDFYETNVDANKEDYSIEGLGQYMLNLPFDIFQQLPLGLQQRINRTRIVNN